MMRHDAILNVITEALHTYIKELCDESFQRGVERGRFEERYAQRLEEAARDKWWVK